LISFIAGTNCDTVLNEIIVNFSPTTQSPTPEPATFGLIGLSLVGLGIFARKSRRD
jgi:hypothetical protein